MAKLDNNKGVISIIGILLLGVIVILVLSYYNVSIKTVVESPTGRENIHYVGGAGISLWDTYLKQPLTYFWNIWVELFWRPFVDNIRRIRDNLPTDFEIHAPTVNFSP
jgi:hypothetical protein